MTTWESAFVIFNINDVKYINIFDIQNQAKLPNIDVNDSKDIAKYDFKICSISLLTISFDTNKTKLITIND